MYIKFFKRFIDIVVSFIVLIFCSLIFIIICVSIKLLDPGPIFFISKRVGKNNCTFNFYKFRTMPINTSLEPSDKLMNIKLSETGKFLRRYNLDELPQLLNILKGDMSLVGPRPSLLSQKELIEIREKDGSLRCKPGLTGLAQVNSYNGMSVMSKAKYDCEYANNISFFLDIKIIFKTFNYLRKLPPVY